MDGERDTRIAPVVIYAALFIVIILGIRMMAGIVSIILVSLILTLMLLPAMAYLTKRGWSDTAAVSILTLAAIACLLALVFLSAWSFAMVTKDLPLYQTQLDARLAETLSMFGTNMGAAKEMFVSAIDLGEIIQVVVSSILTAGEAVIVVFIIGVTTFFMLLEAPKIPARLSQFTGGDLVPFREISRMSRYIIDFMIVRTETNAVHGILFSSSLWIMGVHGAPAWGLLTFALGYIPYIGLLVAAIPAILFAYIQFGIWGVIAVIALVCALNLIVENPVFSYLASRRFDIPALLVILSVIFWGWLLGIAGMFFSVPLTLIVLIIFQCNGDLRAINTVLGVSHLFTPEDSCKDPGTAPPVQD